MNKGTYNGTPVRSLVVKNGQTIMLPAVAKFYRRSPYTGMFPDSPVECLLLLSLDNCLEYTHLSNMYQGNDSKIEYVPIRTMEDAAQYLKVPVTVMLSPETEILNDQFLLTHSRKVMDPEAARFPHWAELLGSLADWVCSAVRRLYGKDKH